MSSKVFAYVDESGNSDLSLEKQGASSYYIISAILVQEADKTSLEARCESLRKKYFQTGEMKSSSIGKNDKRRIKILSEIKGLGFTFYSIVVHKERIDRDSGLQWKKSFLKNLNKKLYNVLYKTNPFLHVVADEHGKPEFQESFKKYIEKNCISDLFQKSEFSMASSKDAVLVQLADFIAGTTARIYDGKAGEALKEAYRELLSSKHCLYVDEWPLVRKTPDDIKITRDFSGLIHDFSLNMALVFIEENEGLDEEEVVLQVAVVRHLLFYSQFVDEKDYVPTHKILDYLRDNRYGEISQYVLRSKVIAPLRDADVVIASSNKGYKIPHNFDDMRDFVERVDSIVTPLLSRLGRARRNLKITSKNEMDILTGSKYPHLVDFIDILDKKSR